MATIYKLITRLEADPKPMQEGFNRGLAITREFAANAATLLSTPPRDARGQFTKFGTDAAQNFVAGLEKEYASRQSELREAFARGSLSRNGFVELGEDAAKSFNTALLNGISEKAASARGLSPEARQALVGGLKEAGISGAESVVSGLTQIGGKLRSLGRDFTQFGREASIGLTAPIIAMQVGFIAAAEEIDHALDEVRNKTGATGTVLAGLSETVHRLFLELPSSAGDIATALSTISTISGATGSELEGLTKQTLNLARVTGVDLHTAVDGTQRTFQAWNVSTANQSSELDLLFRASQKSGQGIDAITGTLTRFAPALKQFGLSFGQSVALVGQLGKNGIEADTVLQAMQLSLERFAQKGKDGAQAFRIIIDSIKNAKTDDVAVDLASRVLGSRQAVQISAAIRSGKLDFQAFADQIAASNSTINAAAATTDVFNGKLIELRHRVGDAGDAIGSSLEAQFIAIQPTLLKGAHLIEEFAKSFSTLPVAIQGTITGIAALLAGIGPLSLLLGGLTKGTGALILGIGILKDAAAGVRLGNMAQEAGNVEFAMSDAAVASQKLVAGLRALAIASTVVLALAAIVFFYRELTKESREAAERLDQFKSSLNGLSQVQLTVRTDQLQRDIADRQKEIDALRKSAAQANPSFAQRFAAAVSGEQTGGETDQSSRERDLAGKLKDARADSVALAEQVTKVGKEMQAAADGAAAFNLNVSNLATKLSSGAVRIDKDGKAAGDLEHLRALAAFLNQELNATKPIKGLDIQATDVLLGKVNTQINEITKGKDGIGDIFGKLSPGVALLEKGVAGLLSQLGEMPHAFDQIASIRLNKDIFADLKSINAQLKGLGTSTTEDAEKLRSLKKSLEGTVAGQIAGDHPGSPVFVEVEGRIKEIKVDPAAGVKFLKELAPLLKEADSVTERAGAAEASQRAAVASGDFARAAAATVELQKNYTLARLAQERYTEAVRTSGLTSDGARAAAKLLTDAMQKVGANAGEIAKAHIGLASVDPADIERFKTEITEALQRFGDFAIDVIPIPNRVAFHKIATDAALELKNAQVFAFAGDTGASVNANLDALQKVATAAQKLAREGVAQGGLGLAVTMQAIEQAAKDANIPVQQLLDELDRLSSVGQRKETIELTKLAGDAATASALQKSFVDDVARSIQDLAKQALAGRKGAFQELQLELKKTGVSVQEVTAALEAMTHLSRITALAGAFHLMTTAILGTSSAIGQFIDSIGTAVDAGLKLVKTLEDVHKANLEATSNAGNAGGIDTLQNAVKLLPQIGQAISGAIGVVKGIVSFIGGLFGESAIQKEHDAAVKSNSDALKALTASLDRQAGTAGQAGDIIQAVGAQQAKIAALTAAVEAAAKVPGATDVGIGAINNPAAAALQAAQEALGHAKSVGEFTKILSTYNLTLDQAVAAAKAFGITLLDSNKNINPQAMDAFMKAEALAAANLTTLANDFQTTANFLAIKNKVDGTTVTPALTLSNTVDAVNNALTRGGKVTSAIADELTKAMKDGPAALRVELQKLLKAVHDGTLSLTDLGAFKDVNDFLNAIGSMADATNALTAATNATTQSMVNVPIGFKKALEVFNATTGTQNAPGSTIPVPPKPAPLPTDTVPTRPPDTGGALLDVVHALFDKIKSQPPLVLTDLTTSTTTLDKVVTDVASTLGTKLPDAGNTATVSMSNLTTALGTVDDALKASILALGSVSLTPPTFHVEQSSSVTLPAPPVLYQPSQPKILTPPTITFSPLAPVTLKPPVVTVAPFAPITLAAPQITVASSAAPLTIAPPIVVLAHPLADLAVDPPVVSLTAPLANFTIAPPMVSLTGPIAPVSLAPPSVTVAPLTDTINLAAPPVTVALFAPIVLAAPTITVGTLAPLSLSAPPVTVLPFASLSLAAPTVTVAPLASISMAAPAISVLPSAAVVIPPPSVTLSGPIADLQVPPPRITLAAPLSPIIVAPPTVTPSRFAPIHFAAPVVTVEPLKPIKLHVPEISTTEPNVKLPRGTTATPSESQALTAALTILASRSGGSGTGGGSEMHLHNPVFNIDARDKTAAELFVKVKREVQKFARQITGDSTRIVDAFQRG